MNEEIEILNEDGISVQSEEQVLVTKSFLTNIATAIRSKLGTTDKFFPSEMADAIDLIETLNFSSMGANPVLVKEVVETKKFSEITGYSSWNPSTTATTLEAATTGETVSGLNLANYDVAVRTIIITNFVYTGSQPKSSISKFVMINDGCVCRRYTTKTAFDSGTPNYNVAYTGISAHGLKYMTSAGAVSYNSQTYGIYPSTFSAVTLSSTSSSTPTITLKRPAILIRANSSYMSTSAFNSVDAENSTLTIKYQIYHVKKNTSKAGAIYNDVFGLI